MTSTINENSLYDSNSKAAFLADDTLIAEAFAYSFFGILGALAGTKKPNRFKDYLKRDKKVKIQSISDENNDTSLSLKLVNDKGWFKTSDTVNKATRLLAKLKASGITIDSDIVRDEYAKALKDEFYRVLSPKVREDMTRFKNGEIDLPQLTFILRAHRDRFNKFEEFAKLIRGAQFKPDARISRNPKKNKPVASTGIAASQTVDAPKNDTQTQQKDIDTTPVEKTYLFGIPDDYNKKVGQTTWGLPALDNMILTLVNDKFLTNPEKLYSNLFKLAKDAMNDNAEDRAIFWNIISIYSFTAHYFLVGDDYNTFLSNMVSVFNRIFNELTDHNKDDKYITYNKNHIRAEYKRESVAPVLRELFDAYLSTPEYAFHGATMYLLGHELSKSKYIYEKILKDYGSEISKNINDSNFFNIMKGLYQAINTYSYKYSAYRDLGFDKYIKLNVKDFTLRDAIMKFVFLNNEPAYTSPDRSLQAIYTLLSKEEIISLFSTTTVPNWQEEFVENFIEKKSPPRDYSPIIVEKLLRDNLGTGETMSYVESRNIAKIIFTDGAIKKIFDLYGNGSVSVIEVDSIGKEISDLLDDLKRFKYFLPSIGSLVTYSTVEESQKIVLEFFKNNIVIDEDESVKDIKNKLSRNIGIGSDPDILVDFVNDLYEKNSKIAGIDSITKFLKSALSDPDIETKLTDKDLNALLKGTLYSAPKVANSNLANPDEPLKALYGIFDGKKFDVDYSSLFGYNLDAKYSLGFVVHDDDKFDGYKKFITDPDNRNQNNHAKSSLFERVMAPAYSVAWDDETIQKFSTPEIIEALSDLGTRKKNTITNWKYKNRYRETQRIIRARIFNLFGHLLEKDRKAADELYSKLPRTIQGAIRDSYNGKKYLVRELQEGALPTFESNIDARRMEQILSYNDIDISELPIPASRFSKKDTISTWIDKQKSKMGDETNFLGEIHVEDSNMSDEEIKKYNHEFIQNNYAGKHGNVYPIIEKVFNVTLPSELYEKFKEEMEKEGHDKQIIPAFHGTGGIAANMILRNGFKVIPSSDSSAVGRMLGDGIYFSNKIDKATQYVGNSGYGRREGTKGFIFVMESVLGKNGKDYREAGTGRDSIRSPEWVVKDGNKQLKIVRALQVELRPHRVYRQRVLGENVSLNFKEFLNEAKLNNVTDTETFIFKGTDIAIVKNGRLESVPYNKWKSIKLPKGARIIDSHGNVQISFPSTRTEVHDVLTVMGMPLKYENRFIHLWNSLKR